MIVLLSILACSTFMPDVSAAQLAERFGAANVTTADISIGEGDTEPGTVLFADRPEDRVEILWKDQSAQRRPRAVMVRADKSQWRTKGGLTPGMTLREVERLNRRPFRLLGFSWDYEGTVSTWSGGAAAESAGDKCTMRARLRPSPAGEPEEKWHRQVQGDREFSSGHPAMQALNPRVYEIWLEYP